MNKLKIKKLTRKQIICHGKYFGIKRKGILEYIFISKYKKRLIEAFKSKRTRVVVKDVNDKGSGFSLSSMREGAWKNDSKNQRVSIL